MFTGIITEVGSVRSLQRNGHEAAITVGCTYPALVLGESIAVDGACLTVARIEEQAFVAYASEETLAKTTLGTYRPGRRVNLERALALGDRLGGHIVSGHVDGVGTLLSRVPAGQAERWTFSAPDEVARFIAAKGSITIDGTSLTVNELHAAERTFSVMLVPFTLGHTALGDRRPGASVNLEADVLARYVARALEAPRENSGGVTLELLERAGMIPRK